MVTHVHNRRFRLMALLPLSLALLIALGTIQVAKALEIDDDGIIAASEVIDDDVFIESSKAVVDGTVNGVLIANANEAEINGTVNGDLAIFAAHATVNGQVNGNLIVGGRVLTLNGAVEGSVFYAGSTLILGPSAAVERNLLFGGYSVEMTPGSTVGRDVYAGSYQALLRGEIGRDVSAEVSALEIAGSVGRDVTATVEKPDPDAPRMFQILRWPGMPEEVIASGLQVRESAEIEGTLTYRSPVEQAEAIKSSAIGAVVYEYVPGDDPELTPAVKIQQWLVARLREFLTLLVLGALVAWKMPILLSRSADQARAKPLSAILWGLLAWIAGIVGVSVLSLLLLILGLLLAAVTLGELSTAVIFAGASALVLAVTLFSLTVSYGTKLIVAYLIGRPIVKRLAPGSAERVFRPLLLGIVLYLLVRSIPCVGGIAWVITTLIGLGALWLLFRQRRSAPEPMETGKPWD
ncbi:MAG: polymer-forming cytoskeletal protein [Anaerolineae bacterium]|nr:polymer-forming cytoskeletal protein [Anaerolineae bacterium]